MKTGFDTLSEAPDVDDFVTQTTSMFLVLVEEAMRAAGDYANAAGRTTVTKEDMLYGLQYQAHQFQNIQDIRGRSEQALQTWDDAASDEDEEDEEDEVEVVDELEEPFTRAPDAHSSYIALMNYCHDNWDTWVPETDVEKLLKETVDSRIHRE